jgi:shikimate dehydrogenase
VTRLAGVLGWPLEHTRSPALHQAAYASLALDAIYLPLPVAPEGVADAVKGAAAMGFMGLNVTVPHKEAVVPLCDVLDPVAERAGAVNTILFAQGRRVGHNTDVGGLADSLGELPSLPLEAGGLAVVLGAGGAARAAVLALSGLGLSCAVVARTPDKARPLLALGAREVAPFTAQAMEKVFAQAMVLLDATSIGLDPRAEAELGVRLPIDALPARALVVSLVYHREPSLLREARARGLAVLDGKGMLVHQAARAFTLMTGLPAPLSAMRAAL